MSLRIGYEIRQRNLFRFQTEFTMSSNRVRLDDIYFSISTFYRALILISYTL